MTRQMTGAKMVIQALKEQGVDTVFGYPGGAVLPIYDAILNKTKFSIFSCVMNKAQCMRQRAMRAPQENPALCL